MIRLAHDTLSNPHSPSMTKSACTSTPEAYVQNTFAILVDVAGHALIPIHCYLARSCVISFGLVPPSVSFLVYYYTASSYSPLVSCVGAQRHESRHMRTQMSRGACVQYVLVPSSVLVFLVLCKGTLLMLTSFLNRTGHQLSVEGGKYRFLNVWPTT